MSNLRQGNSYKIKYFESTDCPKCKTAREVIQNLIEEGYDVEIYDIGEVNGLTEASVHGILSTPALIVVDEEETKAGVYGKIGIREIREMLKGFTWH